MLMIEMLVNNLVSAAKMVGYATSGNERSSHLNAVEDARKLLLDAIVVQTAATTPGWKLMPPSPDDGMLKDAMVAVRAANFIVNGEPPRKPEVQERILLNAAYTAMFNRAPAPSTEEPFDG